MFVIIRQWQLQGMVCIVSGMNFCTISSSECLFSRYANENRYELAMKDFQEALKQNPKHKNARKYLAETLAAQGNR